VVSDVPVDDDAPLVTSGISRSVGAQSFGGAHRGKVCVRVFIGVSVCVVSVSVVLCNSKKRCLLMRYSYGLQGQLLTNFLSISISAGAQSFGGAHRGRFAYVYS
jgi:hypothetical protein